MIKLEIVVELEMFHVNSVLMLAAFLVGLMETKIILSNNFFVL